jgi:hypothetical protein
MEACGVIKRHSIAEARPGRTPLESRMRTGDVDLEAVLLYRHVDVWQR